MTDHRSPAISHASQKDAMSIHQLRLALEEWLEAKGVQQWGRNGVGEQEIIEQVAAGEWFIARDDKGVLSAAQRVLWSDPFVWGEDTTPAVYVHGLMVDRRAAGQNLGRGMLEWAAEFGWAKAKSVFRVDCTESNATLRSFYQQQGFIEVGRRDFDGPWFSATLLEKPLTPLR